MSTFVHKPNTGTLFPNDRKESHTHADFKGSGIVNGKEVWLDMWQNDRGGKPWFKVSIREKDAQRTAAPAPEPQPVTAQLLPGDRDGFEDDKLPW